MQSENWAFVGCVMFITACLTGLVAFGIYTSHKNALVRAEVQKHRADEGIKFKFGITKDKQGTQ